MLSPIARQIPPESPEVQSPSAPTSAPTSAPRPVTPSRGARWVWLLTLLLLATALWLPRGLELDRFVTVDERLWLARSGNFYQALVHGNWAGTFQRHHPGVTVTWAGLGGFLLTYPGYALDAPGPFGTVGEQIEPFLRSQGVDPLRVLAASRAMVAALIVAGLLVAFVYAARLVGRPAALVGLLLVAFAPFHIAHARLLHLDGLVSALMLPALLAWWDHLRTRGRVSLAVAAVATGLAWLTRSPALFLGPFMALSGLLYAALSAGRPWGRVLRSGVLLATGSIALFVLLWPAMWVDPLGSLAQILDAAGDYAAEGHSNPIFFNGEIHAGDPGYLFYALTYLWRSTPITQLGLLWAYLAYLLHWAPLDQRPTRRALTALVAFALGFLLFMEIGDKKFDRYLLPIYPPLELVAGVGWVALLFQLSRLLRQRATRALPWLLALPIMAQAAFALPTHPYYLSYYNPTLGGASRAPEVMMIGWGEGADQVGRLLAEQLNADRLTVSAGYYPVGPLSYYYTGEVLPLTYAHLADYAAFFLQDRQRLQPARRVAVYFDALPPAQIVTLNGMEYAHLIDLRTAPPPEYMTDWLDGDATDGQANAVIRLVSYQAPSAPIEPGETVRVVFYLLNRAPIYGNLTVVARLVGEDGREIARSEGWPWGAATSAWEQGDVWPDGHDLTVPADTPPGYYRIELGFYDPETGDLLPPRQTLTGAALPDLVPVEVVRVGRLPTAYTQFFTPPLLLGELALLGAEWEQAGELVMPGASVTPDLPLAITLTWMARRRTDEDYTAFVHWVGPNGALVAQDDQPPANGWLPTHEWVAGHRVADTFNLTLPASAPPGEYTLYTGFYDPLDGVRLPVRQAGDDYGDIFLLGTVRVAR